MNLLHYAGPVLSILSLFSLKARLNGCKYLLSEWERRSDRKSLCVSARVCVRVCASVCGFHCGFASVSMYAIVWRWSDRAASFSSVSRIYTAATATGLNLTTCVCVCVCVGGCTIQGIRSKGHCQSRTAEGEGKQYEATGIINPSLVWVQQVITISHMAVRLPEGDSSDTHTHTHTLACRHPQSSTHTTRCFGSLSQGIVK